MRRTCIKTTLAVSEILSKPPTNAKLEAKRQIFIRQYAAEIIALLKQYIALGRRTNHLGEKELHDLYSTLIPYEKQIAVKIRYWWKHASYISPDTMIKEVSDLYLEMYKSGKTEIGYVISAMRKFWSKAKDIVE